MLDDTKLAEARIGATPGNRLLARLPPAEAARLDPYLATGSVAAGEVILQPQDAAQEVLFPAAGTVLTLLAVLPDRKPVETAMIGAEGATGALFGPVAGGFGFRIQVLTGGPLLRLPAFRFAEAMEASPALRAGVLRYAGALAAQLQMGVACAALHPVEARAARWMLDLEARTNERALPLTQEALADLLGVRRTTITRVVATLEERGLVRHRRGRIIVTDRAGLEAAGCACHAVTRARFEAVAPGLLATRESGR